MHCCGKLGEFGGQLLGPLARLAFGHDTIGQPDRESFGGVDAAAGENQVHRTAVTDQPRQSHRAAVDQRNAPPPAEHAEHRVLLDDAHVAPQRQLQAARDGVAADGCDHRLGQHHSARPHRTGSGAMHRVGIRRAESLEIGSSTECSVVTPQHGDRSRVVLVELVERCVQSRRRGRVDGVARLRPIHDHRRHRDRCARPALHRSSCCLHQFDAVSPRDQFRGEVRVGVPQCVTGPVFGQQLGGQHRVGEQVAHDGRRGDELAGNVAGRCYFVEQFTATCAPIPAGPTVGRRAPAGSSSLACSTRTRSSTPADSSTSRLSGRSQTPREARRTACPAAWFAAQARVRASVPTLVITRVVHVPSHLLSRGLIASSWRRCRASSRSDSR